MLSHSACITHFTKSLDGSLYQVVGVRRTLRLSQNVGDTYTFEHGAHSTTGYYSSTFRSGEDKHLSTAEASSLFVRNSTFDDGHLHKVLLGSFNTLSNSGSNFASLTKTVTDNTLTITNYYDSSESESATTLSNLGYTIDSNESIFQFFIVCIYSVCHNL